MRRVGGSAGWRNVARNDFFSLVDSLLRLALLRLEAARVRLNPIELRLPVTFRAAGLSSFTVQGINVSRVFASMFLVPVFNFCKVDGPVFGVLSLFAHCGIVSFGSCSFGIVNFGNVGLGSLGSESLGNENPVRCSAAGSGSSETFAETPRLRFTGSLNGLITSLVSSAQTEELLLATKQQKVSSAKNLRMRNAPLKSSLCTYAERQYPQGLARG